ncbi:hypothetical protein OK411_12535 [Pseudomonas sp. RG1]|uniref:hypothetical protein n=1 Tax=Pseudomonas sp. RG1 TaxID=2981602 RepID=UPI00221EB423|nr:hypothetical protein [Pseudomonas sp. RG1]MCW0921211.1 hypothetical protein [Pseudomonas sp. RG1]
MAVDLGVVSGLIVRLQREADISYSENSFGANYSGLLSVTSREVLSELSKLICEHAIPSIRLQVDGQDEAWDEVDFSDPRMLDWVVSITDKAALLRDSLAINVDIDGLLFFDKVYFLETWLPKVSGLLGGDLHQSLKSERPLKIFLCGFEDAFGGPRIAIVPTNKYDQALPVEWMMSTKLPNLERLLKSVHFVTGNAVMVSPERFLFNWGRIDNAIAAYFNKACVVYAMISLVQEFYDWDKVVLKGRRKLELSVCDNVLQEFSKRDTDAVIACVEWCYAESDEETRTLLVVDRLTLDLKDDQALTGAVRLVFAAFAEARSRYKYVVLDRKKDYTKELSDIQKDLSGVVDKYVAASHQFTGSLLTDVLALAFVLTAGVVSRRFIAEDALKSPEAVVLFKSFSIYLAVAVILRFWGAISVSLISTKLFTDWKDIVRSHMSAEELQKIVDNSLFSVKLNFWITCVVVFVIYVVMAISCWNVELTLNLFGVLGR